MQKHYVTKQSLKLHIQANNQYRLNTHTSATFKASNYLSGHVLRQHSNRKFKCTQCRYTASTKASIRRHVLNVHTETTKKFKCKHCDFTAKAKDYVNKHEKTLHEGKSYSCDDCSFATDHY